MKRQLLFMLVALATVLTPAGAFAYSYTFSCGPSWANLPVPYWINSAGSADVPFSQVETIIEDSFAVWGDPCCSRFAAEYRGTTSLTATNNQGRVVLSWVEDSWNPQWGSVNQTIGITFSSVFNNCTIAEAPIIFNGVGFRFTTNGTGTDLQSIATHEIGHLAGLGHSNLQNATMYAAYVGGTGARSLHQDDIDGICSLYTRSCSCSSSSQCASNEQCIGGQCQVPPCTNDSQCDPGLECNTATGKCVIPPCSTSADCSAGFVCQNSICVSGCPVCRQNCTTNADCGSGGFCVDNVDGSKVCLVLCGQSAECPGDAVCYRVPDGQGGEAFVCGSPDAVDSLCPDEYVCQDTGVTNECDSLSDCDPGELCVNTTSGRRCEVPEDPCATVTCGDGLICENGICIREDISEPSNNTPGNNNAGANNTPGTDNNGTGEPVTPGSDDPLIIIYAADDDDGGGCCTVARSPRVPFPAVLLLGGLFVWRRRRR